MGRVLSTQTESLNKGGVPSDVLIGEVPEEPPALPHELQQSSPAAVVVLVNPEVIGKLVDAPSDQRYLYFR